MSQALESWFGNFSESFNAIKIGKVQGVNVDNQTVDVQILHKRKSIKSNKLELRDYSLLQGVPFVILGGGTSSLTFPISIGDNCLLLFCDYEIDRWWDTGENLPANFERRHDISDAFALIGVHSMVDLIEGYSKYVKLKYSDSSFIQVGKYITLNNGLTLATGKLGVEDNITASKNLNVAGNIVGEAKATAELHDSRGISGSFTTVDGKTITVVDGIITNIA